MNDRPSIFTVMSFTRLKNGNYKYYFHKVAARSSAEAEKFLREEDQLGALAIATENFITTDEEQSLGWSTHWFVNDTCQAGIWTPKEFAAWKEEQTNPIPIGKVTVSPNYRKF